MILTLIILSITFEAWMDGFRSKSKPWHLQKIGLLLPLLLIPYWYDTGIVWLIAGYTLIRIGLFDMLNNAFAGRKINHRGDNWWDRLVDKLNPPLGAELFGRAVFLFAGIMIVLQNL